MPVALVVFDTLSAMRAGGGRAENDNDDMAEIAKIVRSVADDTGAHTLIIHHKGHARKGLRGGSALEGDLDTFLELGAGVLSNPKQRDLEKAPDMVVRLEPISIMTGDGEATGKVAIVQPFAAADPLTAAKASAPADRVAKPPFKISKLEKLKIEVRDAIFKHDRKGESLTVEGLRNFLKDKGCLGLDDNGAVTVAARQMFGDAVGQLRRGEEIAQFGKTLRSVGALAPDFSS